MRLWARSRRGVEGAALLAAVEATCCSRWFGGTPGGKTTVPRMCRPGDCQSRCVVGGARVDHLSTVMSQIALTYTEPSLLNGSGLTL